MLRTIVALGALALSVGAPAAAQEATLEEVLESHYEAIGGLDTWEAVESARFTGTMSMPQGIEAPFVMVFKRPDMSRLEFTAQGMTGVQAFDGETAWMIMPFMGKTEPEPMPAEQTDMMREQADFDGPLIDWEEKGHELELLGTEEVEGTEAYKIKVTRASGVERTYYLDAEYFLPIKVTGTNEIQGQEQSFEQIYGDYKEVDGLLIAHSIETRPQGAPQGQVITIEQSELGVELDDEQFSMPEAPAAGDEPADEEAADEEADE